MKNKYCPNCDTKLLEVRKAKIGFQGKERIVNVYPKEIHEPNLKKVYHEHRFYCNNCGKEWIYYTTERLFEEVPEDSQFYYSEKEGLLILRGKK